MSLGPLQSRGGDIQESGAGVLLDHFWPMSLRDVVLLSGVTVALQQANNQKNKDFN